MAAAAVGTPNKKTMAGTRFRMGVLAFLVEPHCRLRTDDSAISCCSVRRRKRLEMSRYQDRHSAWQVE